MNYNSLRYFVTLAETGQYTQASQRLYISQPSLSYAISNLEKELGVRLFCKSGRRMQLTPSGQRFYSSVSQALHMIDGCVASLQKQGPVIRLCTIHHPDHDLLPQMILRFEQRTSVQASFSLEQGSAASVFAKVRDGACDFGVCTYEPIPELSFTPLKSYPFKLITPLGHPLAAKRQVLFQELQAYPLIGYPESSAVFQPFRDTPFAGQLPAARCVCEDEEAMARLVEQGCGIALMPDYAFLREQRVCRLEVPELQMTYTLYLACAKNRRRSVPCDLFYGSFCETATAPKREI